jgi:hypothetical protein
MKTLGTILITMVLAAGIFAASETLGANFSVLPAGEEKIFGLDFYDGFVFQNSFNETQNCSVYFGKGYCVDYIAFKTGKRQRGNANQWSGNIPTNQGKGGDVAIFDSPSPYGHVAYIVRPVYQHNTANLIGYDIEEWNWGSKWVNRGCGVTDKFGSTTSRRISVSQVSRIWRP